jgi:outer membrane receptor for ferrienterochelin and colicins
MNKQFGIRSAVLILGAWLMAGGVQAKEAAASEPMPDEALLELLQVLDQETQIATKTKMNVDFVPGMVSVLYGEDLAARGVRDAGDALALIPGIELSMSSDGTTLVFVRGIGSVFASGKIKVLLNGADFNSTLSVATTALTIPVEMIDRIEVIRGPGSTLYGEFAYSGVVNIVTRQKANQVFVRYGSLGQKTAGAQLFHASPDGDWHTSLSFTGTNIDGDSVDAGPDVLRNTPYSRAPGPSNEVEQDRALILRTGYKDFSLNVQWSQVYSGDHFGLANALPAPEPRLIRRVGMLGVDAEQKFDLGPDLSGRFLAGWLDYKLASGLHQLYPPDFLTNPMTAQRPFPDGVLGSPNYAERKYHLGTEFHYTGMVGHDLVGGLAWSYTDEGRVYAVRNYNPTVPPTPAPLAIYTGADNWLGEGLTRRLLAGYVQDQYSVNDRLTVTAGVRYDSYDDVGAATSPRVAAVYQLSDRQTLKVQFARAFRPPTFLETATKNNPIVVGSANIESEFIDNYELGYIYNDGVTTGRVTSYFADLHNLIVVDPSSSPGTYVNAGEVHVYGLELEYARQFGHQFKLDSNLSLSDAENALDKTTVADVARVTGNLGLLYRPGGSYTYALQYHYVGDRKRAAGDPRSDLGGYQTVDVTASADDIGMSGLSARLGVYNLFDDKVVYPAPLVSFGGAVIPSYPEDYPRPGREYWLQMQYAFK